MPGEADTPLELLIRDFLPEASAKAVEEVAATVDELPPAVPLGDLKTPDYGNDPTELLQHRFLYLGGICLLIGPTGVGKSSLLMQLAIHFSVGRGLFGLEPGAYFRLRGMRILFVQAENDAGDMAEMRDGTLKGCTDLTEDERRLACSRVVVCTIADRSASRFTSALEVLLARHGPFDLVVIDPAYAYLGGESNSQKDVSHFMRELLNPLLQKCRVGLILAHHSNKPPRGKEKEGWAAGDYAYLGAGSAEWINPARAALALRSIGSDSVFEFRAAKRGRRLRWKDAEGRFTNVRHIAHHGEPGVICWREAAPAEVEDTLQPADRGGRPRKCEPVEVLQCVLANPGQNQLYYKKALAESLGCGQNTVQDVIAECVRKKLLRATETGRGRQYQVTSEGQKWTENHSGLIHWQNQKPETMSKGFPV